MDANLPTEKATHQAHRDALAVYFASHPYEVVSWETLEELVGRNYQQRISDARRDLKMEIENIPRMGPNGKRLTGDYRFRPSALGREADTFIPGDPLTGTLFRDLHPSGWQESSSGSKA